MTHAGCLDKGVHSYIFGYNLMSHGMCRPSIRCKSSPMNFKMNNKHAIVSDGRHVLAFI